MNTVDRFELDKAYHLGGDNGVLQYSQARMNVCTLYRLLDRRRTAVEETHGDSVRIQQVAAVALEHIRAGAVPADMWDDKICIAISPATGYKSFLTWREIIKVLQSVSRPNTVQPTQERYR